MRTVDKSVQNVNSKWLQLLKRHLFRWLRPVTHVHETYTRNLCKFLASNFDASSCKFLYKRADTAAFYSVQGTCIQERLVQKTACQTC